MSEPIYDVVIVGAGVAGAILAKTLTRAGKTVLILEAGMGTSTLDLDGDAARKEYEGYLQTFYNAAAKVPNAPYPNLPAAPSPDVLDIANINGITPATNGYFVQAGPMPFGSDYARTPGGTTLHWLGTTLRMLPNDFRMKTKYGVAEDWPFSYEKLKPYYEMAEHEIGVSATVGQLHYPNTNPKTFFGDYQFPMKGLPPSYMDQKMAKATQGGKVKVGDGSGGKTEIELCVTPTPQGRNSMPNPEYRRKNLVWDKRKKSLEWEAFDDEESYQPVGATWDFYTGERCEGNASCVPICPVQAKYNALKSLKSADRSKLTIHHRAVVFKVEVQSSKNAQGDQPVTGIHYKQYSNPQGYEYVERVAKGRRYVLAAHAVENAKILLASGIANSSDQVGRNLMDHVTLLTWGLKKGKGEEVFPFRGPGSTSNFPVFRDADFRKEHSCFILPIDNWGWSWPTFSPGSDLDEFLGKGLYGKEVLTALKERLTRQVFLHAECEQLPEPTNRVTIDDKYRDKLGNHRPVIHYDISNYLRKAFVAAKSISDQLFKKAGVEDHSNYEPPPPKPGEPPLPKDPCYFTYNGQGFFYRGAGHLVGTHRMGSRPEDSVVNIEQRTWDHSNLFLVGCGNMVTLGTSNPTLTMSALAFWAAENILKDLAKS